MTQEIINIGVSANDGTGDKIRDAFQKVNNNFTELFEFTDDISDYIDNYTIEGQNIVNQLTDITTTLESINNRLTLLEAESRYFNDPMVLESFFISDKDFVEFKPNDLKKTTLIREIGDSVIDLFLQWNLNGDPPSSMLLTYGSSSRNVNLVSTKSYWTPGSPFSTDTLFTLTAIDKTAHTLREIKYSMDVHLKFYNRLYWGVTEVDINGISENVIKNGQYSNSILSDSAASAIDYETNHYPDGSYIFFAYPKIEENYKFTINNITIEGMIFTAYSIREIQITNNYGITMVYNVIVFDHKLRGDNIEVTFT